MPNLDWCRDVDYGNLPQWLALIVGGVVAGFTIFGIITARKAYVEDVRTREYAQARLVYAVVYRVKRMKPDETMYLHPLEIPGYQVFPPEGAQYAYVDWEDSLRKRMVIQSRGNIQVTVVTVHNRSDELISGI